MELLNRKNFIKKSLSVAAASLFVGETGCGTGMLNLKKDLDAVEGRTGVRGANRTYIDAYDYDACIECGNCLRSCPYMDLSDEEAAGAIVKLRQGVDCGKYVEKCLFCFKCNHACPKKAKPAALMLERIANTRKPEERLPVSLAYIINGMEAQGWKKNLFRDIYSGHDQKDRLLLEKWSQPQKGDDMIWCGCGARLFPGTIEHSKALAGLPKFGGAGECCGLYAAKAGLFDTARYVAGNLIERLGKSSFNRLIVLCGSCQEMFTLMMPEYLGMKFPFKVISIYEYLEEEIIAGRLAIQRQADLDAAVSDSCFGYEFGKGYLSAVDSLLRQIGIEPVPLEHCGKKSLCCGMGAYLRHGNVRDLLAARKVKRADLEKSGKKDIVNYCQGCFLNMELLQSGVRSHYLLELALWALGDEITDPGRKIVMKAMNLQSIGSLFRVGPSAIF
jgi:Fe-S oxidoreductase